MRKIEKEEVSSLLTKTLYLNKNFTYHTKHRMIEVDQLWSLFCHVYLSLSHKSDVLKWNKAPPTPLPPTHTPCYKPKIN